MAFFVLEVSRIELMHQIQYFAQQNIDGLPGRAAALVTVGCGAAPAAWSCRHFLWAVNGCIDFMDMKNEKDGQLCIMDLSFRLAVRSVELSAIHVIEG